MRVALVNPIKSFVPPLSLLAIAPIFHRKGCQVKIYDVFPFYDNWLDSPDCYSASIQSILAFKPDIIGVSSMSAEWNAAQYIIRELKRISPETPIMLGGRHPSVYYEDGLRAGADYVFLGEAEDNLKMFLEQFNGNNFIPRGIPGVAFLNGNNDVALTPPSRSFVDINKLPFLAYDLVDYQGYINARNAVAGRALRGGWMITSRGCPNRCIFCYNDMFMRKVRLRNINLVLDEIEYQLAHYRMEAIHFLDDLFCVSEKRVTEFCDGLKKREMKIRFSCQSRINTLTEGMCQKLKMAGCVQLQFGMESGSQRILDFFKKRIRVEQIRYTLKMAKKYGLDVNVNVIVGAPGETMEDIALTKELLQELRPDMVGVTFLTAYPGTELYDMAVKKGWIKNRGELSFRHSTGHPDLHVNYTQEELVKIQEDLYSSVAKFTFIKSLMKKEFISVACTFLLFVLNHPKYLALILKHVLNMNFNRLIPIYREVLFRSSFKEYYA